MAEEERIAEMRAALESIRDEHETPTTEIVSDGKYVSISSQEELDNLLDIIEKIRRSGENE